jgi:hypothetical protein
MRAARRSGDVSGPRRLGLPLPAGVNPCVKTPARMPGSNLALGAATRDPTKLLGTVYDLRVDGLSRGLDSLAEAGSIPTTEQAMSCCIGA